MRMYLLDKELITKHIVIFILCMVTFCVLVSFFMVHQACL